MLLAGKPAGNRTDEPRHVVGFQIVEDRLGYEQERAIAGSDQIVPSGVLQRRREHRSAFAVLEIPPAHLNHRIQIEIEPVDPVAGAPLPAGVQPAAELDDRAVPGAYRRTRAPLRRSARPAP